MGAKNLNCALAMLEAHSSRSRTMEFQNKDRAKRELRKHFPIGFQSLSVIPSRCKTALGRMASCLVLVPVSRIVLRFLPAIDDRAAHNNYSDSFLPAESG